MSLSQYYRNRNPPSRVFLEIPTTAYSGLSLTLLLSSSGYLIFDDIFCNACLPSRVCRSSLKSFFPCPRKSLLMVSIFYFRLPIVCLLFVEFPRRTHYPSKVMRLWPILARGIVDFVKTPVTWHGENDLPGRKSR